MSDNIITFPKNRVNEWAMSPNRAEIDNLHTEIMLLTQLLTDMLDKAKKQDRMMADLEAQNRILAEEVTSLSSAINRLLKSRKP